MLCLLYMYNISMRVFLVQYIYIHHPTNPLTSCFFLKKLIFTCLWNVPRSCNAKCDRPRGWRQCPLQSVAFPKNKALRSSPPLTRLMTVSKEVCFFCHFLLGFFKSILGFTSYVYVIQYTWYMYTYFWYVYMISLRWYLWYNPWIVSYCVSLKFFQAITTWRKLGRFIPASCMGVRYILELDSSHAWKSWFNPTFLVVPKIEYIYITCIYLPSILSTSGWLHNVTIYHVYNDHIYSYVSAWYGSQSICQGLLDCRWQPCLQFIKITLQQLQSCLAVFCGRANQHLIERWT